MEVPSSQDHQVSMATADSLHSRHRPLAAASHALVVQDLFADQPLRNKTQRLPTRVVLTPLLVLRLHQVKRTEIPIIRLPQTLPTHLPSWIRLATSWPSTTLRSFHHISKSRARIGTQCSTRRCSADSMLT